MCFGLPPFRGLSYGKRGFENGAFAANARLLEGGGSAPFPLGGGPPAVVDEGVPLVASSRWRVAPGCVDSVFAAIGSGRAGVVVDDAAPVAAFSS